MHIDICVHVHVFVFDWASVLYMFVLCACLPVRLSVCLFVCCRLLPQRPPLTLVMAVAASFMIFMCACTGNPIGIKKNTCYISFSIYTLYYILHITYSMLYITYYMLYITYCILYIIYYMSYMIYHTWYITYIYMIYYILYIVRTCTYTYKCVPRDCCVCCFRVNH